MEQLTTVFTPAAFCSNRFAVYADNQAPGTSIIPPSSGWIDPSFTKCIPTQYTAPYPTFSPGVCPANMVIVKHTSEVHDSKTVWAAACCQSGFSPMAMAADYMCTSAITTPMGFLVDPVITTADVYTTLTPELYIEHDQITVQWESTDLQHFPSSVASQYTALMGPFTNAATETATITASTSTIESTAITTTTTSALWLTSDWNTPDWEPTTITKSKPSTTDTTMTTVDATPSDPSNGSAKYRAVGLILGLVASASICFNLIS